MYNILPKIHKFTLLYDTKYDTKTGLWYAVAELPATVFLPYLIIALIPFDFKSSTTFSAPSLLPAASPDQNTLPGLRTHNTVHYQAILFLVFHGGRFGNGTKLSIYCQPIAVIA